MAMIMRKTITKAVIRKIIKIIMMIMRTKIRNCIKYIKTLK